MHLKPLYIALAAAALILIGIALWFFFVRTGPEALPSDATSIPAAAGTKEHVADNGQYYSIEGSYPSETPLKGSAGPAADKAAVASMKAFVTGETATFKAENVGNLTAEDIEIQGLGGERRYALDIDYETTASPQTISYIYSVYADTMGAHPNAYLRTFAFDSNTGAELSLADLFLPGSDYLGTLSAKSRASLRATLGENASPDMLEDGTMPVPANFGTFYLDGSMLVIIFPPYQVGPWAIGTQEVRIPRSELSSILEARYR